MNVFADGMNAPSWIVLGILVAIVIAVITVMIIRKKKGKGRCSCCNSDNCPSCHKK